MYLQVFSKNTANEEFIILDVVQQDETAFNALDI